MKIVVRCENSLMDENYEGLLWIHKQRGGVGTLTFDWFDQSGIEWIWHWEGLTVDERRRGRKEIWEGKTLDVPPFTYQALKQSKDLGDEVVVVTSSLDRQSVQKVLDKRGLGSLGIRVEKVADEALMDWLKEEQVDVYIEDRVYRIREALRHKMPVVVRDQTYNENYYNVKRLFCFSQWDELREWALARKEGPKK